MSQVYISEKDIELIFNNLYRSRLFANIAAAFVFYDSILIINTELQTIWSSRWSLPKYLYLYIRVITPIGLFLHAYQLSEFRPGLSTKFCRAWVSFEAIGMTLSVFFANGLLTLRIIALYRHNPRVVWFIRAFYFGSYIATFACGIVAQVAFSGGVFFSQTFGVCFRTETVVGMPFIIPAAFFAPAAFETFIFGLTAYRAWRDQFLLSSPCAAPFMTLLYRDGVIAFLIMVALRIWNIWICFTQPLNNVFMGLPLMWAANTVLTARVYLNLVWLARKPIVNLDTTNEEFSGGVTANFRLQIRQNTTVRTNDL